MPEIRAVCGAFLIAVLTCDLTFDLPVWRALPGDPIARERALGVMTQYYRHVTARGSPFSTGVALVMLGLLASLTYELVSGPKADGLARFLAESSLAVGPIALALIRTFPCARRLATGEGDVTTRTELARAIARDHAAALPAMIIYVVSQVARL